MKPEPHPRAAHRLHRIRGAARSLAFTTVGAVLLTVGVGIAAMSLQVPGHNPDRLWTQIISTTAAIATPLFILAIAALVAVRIATSIYRTNTAAPKGADLS